MHAYDGEFYYAIEEVNFDHVNPIYDTFLFVDDANEWSKQVDEDPYEFNDTCDESSFEDIHELDRDLKLYDITVHPLFQWREVREFDTSRHIPPRCTFSFNDDDYFKDILMFLNPLYESSLNHDEPVPNRKIHRDQINLFDEFIDHLLDTKTLNPNQKSKLRDNLENKILYFSYNKIKTILYF